MDIAQIISTLGFPIACCIALGIYVNKQNEQNREDVKEMNKSHSEEIKEMNQTHNEEIKLLKDEMKESLDNNTQAIRDLTEYIKLKRGE